MAVAAQDIIDAIDAAILANPGATEYTSDGRTVKYTSQEDMLKARAYFAGIVSQTSLANTSNRPAIFFGVRLGRAT